jgi:hypothetical protein
MPGPIVKELLTSVPLQNVSIQYRNAGYIGDRVFPIIDTANPKAKITKYLKGAWFRNEAALRAAGARAKRGSFPTTEVSLSTNEFAFAKEVTDEDRKNAALPNAPALKPEMDAIEFASDKIDLYKEVVVAQNIKDTTWIDGNATGEDAEGLWAASGSNTFLADINTGQKAIQAATGLKANVLVIDYGTFMSLKAEATLLDKIKYTQRGVLTVDLLAALLELEEVLIGEALVNTAKETKAGTEWTGSKIWEVTATKGMGFLFHRAKSAGLKTPSSGYQVRLLQEGGGVRRLTTWREPAEHQDVYEAAEETDIVVTGSDLGYKWKDTLLT